MIVEKALASAPLQWNPVVRSVPWKKKFQTLHCFFSFIFSCLLFFLRVRLPDCNQHFAHLCFDAVSRTKKYRLTFWILKFDYLICATKNRILSGDFYSKINYFTDTTVNVLFLSDFVLKCYCFEQFDFFTYTARIWVFVNLVSLKNL